MRPRQLIIFSCTSRMSPCKARKRVHFECCQCTTETTTKGALQTPNNLSDKHPRLLVTGHDGHLTYISRKVVNCGVKSTGKRFAASMELLGAYQDDDDAADTPSEPLQPVPIKKFTLAVSSAPSVTETLVFLLLFAISFTLECRKAKIQG